MIADRSAYGFSKTLEELIWNVESGKARNPLSCFLENSFSESDRTPVSTPLGSRTLKNRSCCFYRTGARALLVHSVSLGSRSAGLSALVVSLSLTHAQTRPDSLGSRSLLSPSLSLSLSLLLPLSLSSRLCATPVLRLEGRRCLHDRLDDLLRGGKLHVQRRVEGLVCEGA